MTKVTHVAAAVFLRPDGSFLLAQRPEGKPYPGYWEFPGGKMEPGETARDCLVREIKEELDVEVTRATPWITRVHVYTHATVRLNFFRVTEWRGEFNGLEGQAHTWQRVEKLDVGPMLPANTPIFRALSLPPVYGLSNASELGVEAYLQRLDAALVKGLKLIQLREKGMPQDELRKLGQEVVARAHAAGAKVVVSGDAALARELDADGVHLSAAQLMKTNQRDDLSLVGASCHTREEIDYAGALGLDFAVLGSVNRTATHPDISPLGWGRFSELVQAAPLPLYAIGGMTPNDLTTAQEFGAQGIAMQRAVW
jgi:8-oxo-dGTP diphosphatase